MARHLVLGEEAETLAANYLAAKGFAIVARRVRYRVGEIDIVCRDGKDWVFVEVKCRRSRRMGSACEAFTPAKAARMRRAVERYIAEHHLYDQPIRGDFVAIDMEENTAPTITHFPGGIIW